MALIQAAAAHAAPPDERSTANLTHAEPWVNRLATDSLISRLPLVLGGQVPSACRASRTRLATRSASVRYMSGALCVVGGSAPAVAGLGNCCRGEGLLGLLGGGLIHLVDCTKALPPSPFFRVSGLETRFFHQRSINDPKRHGKCCVVRCACGGHVFPASLRTSAMPRAHQRRERSRSKLVPLPPTLASTGSGVASPLVPRGLVDCSSA